MSISAKDIKELRDQTGAGIIDCKKALTEAKGDFKKATEIVRQKGLARAEKKQDRETTAGYIASYVHADSQKAALVEIDCETDFVARNAEFQTMARDVAMQVVAMEPQDVKELLHQEFIKNPSITIESLVKELSGKIGEKFVVARFVRYEVGKQKE